MSLTTVDQGLLGPQAQYTGFKNRIINGAMMIDQRNAGASVTAPVTFPVDRFVQEFAGGGVLTSQQSTDAPSGFTNSLKTTVTTVDSSIAAGDYYQLTHNIEGYNVADFNLGSANASGFIVSFWVKASQTGTYSVALSNSDGSRCYPSTFTINSANTWEYKTITVPATTAGTWLTTNGKGLSLRIGFVYGSSFNGATVNTWGTFSVFANSFATTTNNMMGTSGATFYITGVQLEKGSTATSFDYRPYGTELALCQRYYTKSYDMGVVPSTANPTNNYGLISGSVGAANSTSLKSVTVVYPVPMRTQGTVTLYDIAGNINKASNDNVGSYTNNQAASVYNGGERSFGVFINNGVSCATLAFFYTASAEL